METIRGTGVKRCIPGKIKLALLPTVLPARLIRTNPREICLQFQPRLQWETSISNIPKNWWCFGWEEDVLLCLLLLLLQSSLEVLVGVVS